MKTNFDNTDLQVIAKKGIDLTTIDQQMLGFKTGFPFAKLTAAATIGHGMMKFDALQLKQYREYYQQQRNLVDILKFIPASGAASRMFKHLFEMREALEATSYEQLAKEPKHKDAVFFLENYQQLAFGDELKKWLKAPSEDSSENMKGVLDALLTENGMNYANLPKGLLKFHRTENGSRIALEEHLMEAYQYASGKTANLHFTVSPEHKANFEHQLSQLVPQYEKQCAMAFNITLSTQKSSTDTIAADENNEPFRDAKGQLVFRPGGHGALIENLNELEADLIFIKNIDNVVTDSKREPTIIYKEALAGFGLEMQQQIQQSIVALKNSKPHTEVANFVQQALQIELGSDYEVLSQQEQRDYLYKILNRPLRICGMVKNVGEPGGGPFWVNKRGVSSLQIVESAEIDMQQADQKQIMENATHFNPVDLICFTKDFEGKSFNLKDFVDNEAAFISEKSKDGKTLKAMELPGLWNGAMAFWTTLFVEVPLETFNPVKTVNDLFRPMHQ